MIRKLSLIFTLLFGTLMLTPSYANSDDEIADILKMSSAPDGVVFEIIARSDGLRWAIPKISSYVEQLRKRFPDLPVAVVSHGSEQFALQKKNQQQNKQVHQQVQSLTSSGVPVHVCGTHASWRGVAPEDFVDFVDVAPTGPAQVRDYENLGYILVVLDD